MDTTALANDLNALLALETHGLLRHLDEAQPYLTAATFNIWSDVQQVSQRSRQRTKMLSQLLDSLEMPVRPGGFPSVVANYHFVNVGSLLPLLIDEKKREIELCENAIAHAAGDQTIVATLEELLAEERSDLQLLTDSLAALVPAKA